MSRLTFDKVTKYVVLNVFGIGLPIPVFHSTNSDNHIGMCIDSIFSSEYTNYMECARSRYVYDG